LILKKDIKKKKEAYQLEAQILMIPTMSPFLPAGVKEVEVSTPANSHFYRPDVPTTFIWEKSFEERRELSADPRLSKTREDERQWEGTMVQHMFQTITAFAPSQKDWLMDKSQWVAMLTSVGVTGSHQQERLRKRFDPKRTNFINALIVTKVLHQILTEPSPYQETFYFHCFSLFDRPWKEETIDKATLLKAVLADPRELATKTKGKKSAASALPLRMVAGATYFQVEGLKACISKAQVQPFAGQDATRPTLTLEDFTGMMKDPSNSEWAASFLGPIFDCMSCVFANDPLPHVPAKFEKAAVAIPTSDIMYDADTYLLRIMDDNGGVLLEDTTKKKEKKKDKKQKGK